MAGDSELFVGHDALLAREQRAVDGGAVGAPQVADHPDAVQEPERAVFARNVFEIEADVAARPPADHDLGLGQGDRVSAADGVHDPENFGWGPHGISLKSSICQDLSDTQDRFEIRSRYLLPDEPPTLKGRPAARRTFSFSCRGLASATALG